MERSELDMALAGTEDHVNMIGGGRHELPEDPMMEAIRLGFHQSMQNLIALQKEMRAAVGKEKSLAGA